MNLQPNETSETSAAAPSISAVYRTAIARLIVKIRLACSLPIYEPEQLAAAVEAWGEILVAVVPVERLNDCYLYSARNRDSTFTISAIEILSAWRIINAEETHQRQKSKPCSLCFGQGFGRVYDPKTDTEIVKECPHCNGRVVTSLERVQ